MRYEALVKQAIQRPDQWVEGMREGDRTSVIPSIAYALLKQIAEVRQEGGSVYLRLRKESEGG
jgi:hypothetical protein